MTSAEQQLFGLPQAAPAVDSGKAAAGALVIVVHGTPAPQGSKLRTRFGLVDDNAKTLKPWRKAVTTAARIERAGRPTIDGPVAVDVTISLPRPAGHYRTGRFAHLLRDDAPAWPIARGVGDSDKYARAICDALTDAGVWADDVQAVEVTARKVYAGGGRGLDRPGAVVCVWTVTT